MDASRINILGINAYHGDSSAAIAARGTLLAAVEEERLAREKHWAGIPLNAVKFCLHAAGMKISDIDYIVLSKNPFAHISEKISAALKMGASRALNRIDANIGILSIKEYLKKHLSVQDKIKARIVYLEHHQAHLASGLYGAPFKDALLLSCDGTGDMRTAMWGVAREGRIEIKGSIRSPHSLGFLYSAFTQFLGFLEYGDEYKVMGLAPYGKPNYTKEINNILKIKSDGSFTLDLAYFNINRDSASMTWMNCKPRVGRLYSDKFIKCFGKSRLPGEAIDNRHKDIACSLQSVAEEALVNLVRKLKSKFLQENLCLSGGVFANSAICGRLSQLELFQRIYVPPAPGDAGTAVGALAYFYYQKTAQTIKNISSAFTGPAYNREEIKKAIEARSLKYAELSPEQILDLAVDALIDKKIVGWFQGRMEFGYRALGNRSILAHPGYSQIKEALNKRIKNRESFRPFAPSVMEEHAGELFYGNGSSPYMSFVAKVKEEQIDRIRAVVHVNNTARVHTVSRDDNPLFHKLLQRFYKRTGLPLLLNTSFNENEPIVNSPKEAIDCFLRTRLDVLIMGNYVIRR